MKIVATSNFDDETFSEFFIDSVEPFNKVLRGLNNDEESIIYYRLVGNEYKLKIWSP